MSGRTAPMTTGRRRIATQDALISVVIVVAACAAGLLAALSISHVQAAEDRHQADSLRAADVVLQAHIVEAREWEAAATDDPSTVIPEVRAALEKLGELVGKLDQSDNATAVLGSYFEQFSDAVTDQLAALESGNAELAEQIDEERVDPLFGAFILRASLIEQGATETSQSAQTAGSTLTWLLLGGSGFFVGLCAAIAERLRRRSLAKTFESQQNERFRSLVESSDDVISVVDERGLVRFYSPNVQRLFDVEQSDSIPAAELLPPDAFAEWALADTAVRASETGVRVELQISAQPERFVEANGTQFTTNGEVVWAWRDITVRRRLERQLAHQAFHDRLTGLPNRARFQAHLDEALQAHSTEGRAVSVLLCDLDGFKRVNDTLGHAAGDEMLRIVAQRLAQCVRETDLVARLGGDEFGIVIDDHLGAAKLVAKRILEVVSTEAKVRGHHVLPALSIGIAAVSDTSTDDDVLRRADVAMYEAKALGKGRFAVYHVTMDDQLTLFAELQPELDRALLHDQMELRYQPIVDLISGATVGYEALMRWNHPERGLISPQVFIPIAEATNQISSLGRWALEQAISDATVLHELTGTDLSMHVNLSVCQLRDSTLVDTIEMLLSRSPLPAASLVIEITEGVLLDDDAAIRQLTELRSTGVTIAIDDFGTGYTSITYLRSLPANVLKVDRSFVAEEPGSDDSVSLLGAIVSISASLGMECIGEGVENEAQLARLVKIGCRFGQGFFLGQPDTLAAIREAYTSDRLLTDATPFS
jgi:diguanylate cyclase (GGDEF)-like protein/PAS domain S-box-containing protein